MDRRGFSLIESLLSLSIFLVIVIASLEFFGQTRSLFLKFKQSGEAYEGACAALDKMKIDLFRGGAGLQEAVGLRVLEGIEVQSGKLVITRLEKSYRLAREAVSGGTLIIPETTAGLKPGREICIWDSDKGETGIIASVEGESVRLSTPLKFAYGENGSALGLLDKVTFFLDEAQNILRRKVNNSSAQPLLEEVIRFEFHYDREKCLVRLSLNLIGSGEKQHEMLVFAKNMALVFLP